ncbi:MAG: ABC transporter ATP-binding protein [Methylococcaceae bacterium]|nr:ABC transporter ATP-binding protein [Methylococcaceae bacterium]
MLTAIGLSKQFGSRSIFTGLTFTWFDAGVYLIVGANGAGKSTLLSLLAGALTADSGEIFLSGSSLKSHPDQFRRKLSYCPADCPIFPFLTGRDWLAFVASVRGDCDQATSNRLLKAFGLEPYLDCRFDQMSLGTARKFMLTAAIAATAEVLILDEPCNALDDHSRQALEQVLAELAKTRLVVTACHQASPHQVFGIAPSATLMLQPS